MAEQRPYRLSGTATDLRFGQIKIVVLLSLGAAFVVINWSTTQHVARLFGCSPELGQPWCGHIRLWCTISKARTGR
jgi:hypothetical protein